MPSDAGYSQPELRSSRDLPCSRLPTPSPVVVVKDVGGYVNEYAAQTELYRRTNREVRLHECRSACTMALGLPNVCVYPNSVLKFHQAYDPRNHETNWAVSSQLFGTYPAAVRERLGTLTKQYTVLSGRELIALGMRNCDDQGPRIMVAQATLKPLPETMTSSGGLSLLTGRLQGLVPGLGGTPNVTPIPGDRVVKHTTPALSDGMLQATIPLPPTRPSSVADTPASEEIVPSESPSIPLPPPRPKILVAYTPTLRPIPMIQVIDGSQPILPTRFVPFPKA